LDEIGVKMQEEQEAPEMGSGLHGHTMKTTGKYCLGSAETAEIERHKYFLSERLGYDVGFQAAAGDWLDRHAAEFRQACMLELQRQEIARYKWIESEKVGYDLGRSAALDWVVKYAAQWREWYNRECNPSY